MLTYVRSATQSRFGAVAVKLRSTRPAGLRSRTGRWCAPHLAPDHPLEFEFSHETGNPVTSDLDALPAQLLPDLLDFVDIEVVFVHPCDLGLQFLIAQPAGRGRTRERRIVSRRGDLQGLADRLDPKALSVLVGEAHDLGGRGSSSRAKKAEAALRISLARRSSRFSFSNSAMRCWSGVVTPGR